MDGNLSGQHGAAKRDRREAVMRAYMIDNTTRSEPAHWQARWDPIN